MGVQVDEPGRDDLPRGVDHLVSIGFVDAADAGDLTVDNAYVALVAISAQAIDDGAALNDRIESWHAPVPL